MKVVERTCIGCSTKKDKKDLIRIVLNKNNEIFVDKTGKADGRGAYICDNIECLNKAIKSKRLEKNFNIKLDEELRKKIRGVIIEKRNKKADNQ